MSAPYSTPTIELRRFNIRPFDYYSFATAWQDTVKHWQDMTFLHPLIGKSRKNDVSLTPLLTKSLLQKQKNIHSIQKNSLIPLHIQNIVVSLHTKIKKVP